MKPDTRTDEQKAKSKRAHANSMIVMGALTTVCALAAGLIAVTGGDMPDFMYGRWRSRPSEARPAVRAPRPALVAFSAWGPEAFARARREKKFLLLHLTSTWSRQGRWMEENVYADPACAALAARSLVPVKVDADERPDLAARYLRGWPTTAVLLPDESLVVAGTAMSCPMFQAFVEVLLRRGVEETAAALKTPPRRAGTLPPPLGGPFFPAWETLDAAALSRVLKLEDSVWGGFYRGSADARGEEPEHERLLTDQARAVRALSRLDAAAARRTLAFVERFLAMPGGGYAASLDSEATLPDGRVMDGRAYFALDDAARRARGLPQADRRLLAGPNAEMARAVLESPAATSAQKAHARRTLDLLWTRLVKDGQVRRAPGVDVFWPADQDAVIAAETAAGRLGRARKVAAAKAR